MLVLLNLHSHPATWVLLASLGRKSQHREVELPAQGHTAKQWQLQNLNPGLLDFKAHQS